MNLGLRKFGIWLISLTVVVGAYLLYNRLSEMPDITIKGEATSADTGGENGRSGRTGGRVGGVQINVVQKARYVHLNKKRQVDREFGFEKLLHAVGDEWEIEKPFMNIFRRNFECRITSDKGSVQVETAAGRTTPKDATLSRNVQIRILPKSGSDIKESIIYLDSIDFISSTSQFQTNGPVKFVSEDANMVGTGMKVIYNEELERLDFFEVTNLGRLCIKISSKASLFSSQERAGDTPGEGVSRGQMQRPAEAGVDHVAHTPETLPTDNRDAARQGEGEFYNIVFNDNVRIDTPEHVIVTDQFSINNMFWRKGSRREPNGVDIGDANTAGPAADVGGKTAIAKEIGIDTAGPDSAKRREAALTKQREPNEPDEKSVDVIVTCDGGFRVIPTDSPRISQAADKYSTGSAAGGKGLKKPGDTGGRATFIAREIDYCALADEVHMQGDCSCTMPSQGAGFEREYSLSAPELAVKLAKDRKDKQTAGPAGNIEHLTAGGGVVQLATVNMAGEKQLGFTKLKCLQFDYDRAERMWLAAGPGLIVVDNSKIVEPQKDKRQLGKFDLRRRCFAVVRNFETLRYFLETDRIIADASSERILIDYFPIVEGQDDRQVRASAGHVEVNLAETADGRTELSTLSASNGVSYKEKDIQFEGGEFFFDAAESVIKAWGGESQPCFLNGAIVDGIEYNLRTGKVETKIVRPSTLQLR